MLGAESKLHAIFSADFISLHQGLLGKKERKELSDKELELKNVNWIDFITAIVNQMHSKSTNCR
jgi:hypothetical protein